MGNDAVAHFGNAIKATNSWITAPFIGSASPLNLFLAVGLVIVFVILWSRILGQLSRLV